MTAVTWLWFYFFFRLVLFRLCRLYRFNCFRRNNYFTLIIRFILIFMYRSNRRLFRFGYSIIFYLWLICNFSFFLNRIRQCFCYGIIKYHVIRLFFRDSSNNIVTYCVDIFRLSYICNSAYFLNCFFRYVFCFRSNSRLNFFYIA